MNLLLDFECFFEQQVCSLAHLAGLYKMGGGLAGRAVILSARGAVADLVLWAIARVQSRVFASRSYQQCVSLPARHLAHRPSTEDDVSCRQQCQVNCMPATSIPFGVQLPSHCLPAQSPSSFEDVVYMSADVSVPARYLYFDSNASRSAIARLLFLMWLISRLNVESWAQMQILRNCCCICSFSKCTMSGPFQIRDV